MNLSEPPWNIVLGPIGTKPHIEAMIITYGHSNIQDCTAPWQFPVCSSCMDISCPYRGQTTPPIPDLYVADAPDIAHQKAFGERCLTTPKFLELLKESKAVVPAKKPPTLPPPAPQRTPALSPTPPQPVASLPPVKEADVQVTNSHVGPSKPTFSDITRSVDRMESVESKLGITFNGVMATIQETPDNFGEYMVKVMGEIMSLNEDGFPAALEVRIVAYNTAGQVIGTNIIYVSDNEVGVEVFDEKVFCKDKPSRIRLMPKKV